MNAPQTSQRAPRASPAKDASYYLGPPKATHNARATFTYSNGLFALVVLVGVALLLDALHELFHFSDWLTWGGGFESLWPFTPEIRGLIWPLYGAHNLFGYVAHAFTGSLRLTALLLAFVFLVRLWWRRRHGRA